MDMSKNQSTDVPQYSEAESTQPYPHFYANPSAVEAYPSQPPPSYDVLYTAKAPDHDPQPQAVQFVRVIQHQPQHTVITTPPGGEPQSFIVFSLVCVILAIIVAWPCLAFTLPALIFSVMSKDSSSRGQWPQARSYGRLACGLNIVTLICYVIFIIFIVIVIVR